MGKAMQAYRRTNRQTSVTKRFQSATGLRDSSFARTSNASG